MGRLLHEPTIRLRSLSEERTPMGTPHGGGQAGSHASLQLVRELFGLDTPQGGTSDSPAYDEAPAEGGEAKLAEVRSIDSARKGQ
jgi:hypothetical protein